VFTADFSYTNNGATVSFTDRSVGAHLVSWHWTFGDGASSDDQDPVHKYAKAGTFIVMLTVQNAAGVHATVGKTIIVQTAPGTPSWFLGNLLPYVAIVVLFIMFAAMVAIIRHPAAILFGTIIMLLLLVFINQQYHLFTGG